MIRSNAIITHAIYRANYMLSSNKFMLTSIAFNHPTLTIAVNHKFCQPKKNQQHIKTTNNNAEPANTNKNNKDSRFEQQKENKMNNISQGKAIKSEKEILTQLQEHYGKEEVIELEGENKKYTVVERNYNQTKVPGIQTRKYSNISQLQQDIISTNKFDIMNPSILPKTGAANSYVGITQKLTQISLGNVKIKNQNEAFLSEVDPYNIPADLDIRFDNKKQLKIVGKETSKQQIAKNQCVGDQKGKQMQIQAETIQQKSISELMEKQFGAGVKGYQYHFVKKLRRWDILLTILFSLLITPFIRTFKQLNENHRSTKQIEEERMKEVKQLKKRSFQKVLLESTDFNKIF